MQDKMFLDLPNNAKIPVVGYGTFLTTEAELLSALDAALQAGYRHIDTASAYENEKIIGKVLKEWLESGKVTREELFITTKLPPRGMRPCGVSKYLKQSLEDLQLDYVDLYLIHTPFGFQDTAHFPMKDDGLVDLDMTTDHVAIWKKMEEEQLAGRTKNIGLSNFNRTQIQRILDNCTIRPCNLQIETHGYNQQHDMVCFCNMNNITVTAYAPLGAPGVNTFYQFFGEKAEFPRLIEHPTILKIAKKHNKTASNVLLRNLFQRGLAFLPKSVTPSRIQENINIFDFGLDSDDMEAIRKINQDMRMFDFKIIHGVENHPEYPF